MPLIRKEDIERYVSTGGSIRTALPEEPQFKTGDIVVARNINPRTHTRLPRYARGKRGLVTACRGGFGFADTRAHGLGENPQYVYSVRFEATELWGPDAGAGDRDAVYLDMWESYLEHAAKPQGVFRA